MGNATSFAGTPATVEWVRMFADQAVADDLPHLAALCVFMFGTAARVGEACRLLWRDVDLCAAKATISSAVIVRFVNSKRRPGVKSSKV